MDLVDLGRRLLPAPVRYFVQRHVSLTAYKLRARAADDPYAGVLSSSANQAASPYRFGIVRNSSCYHSHWVGACLEESVPFVVLDLKQEGWLEAVRNAECDALLFWPDGFLTIWADMLKERVELLHRELGLPVFPTLPEVWLYEDKRRLAYWLRLKDVAHPPTRVFYDEEEALGYCASCVLPIVFKSSFGASSTGVRIFRDRASLRRFVTRVFRRGFVPNGVDLRDKQWGSVILQEFIPEAKEWRVVRIGDSFLCRLKERRGDFHSGSGLVGWARPRQEVLELAERVTDLGRFRSMGVDILEDADGHLFVNELQTVFGGIRESNLDRGAEYRGKWFRDSGTGPWRFEAGDFYRNACANERLRYLLRKGFPA